MKKQKPKPVARKLNTKPRSRKQAPMYRKGAALGPATYGKSMAGKS